MNKAIELKNDSVAIIDISQNGNEYYITAFDENKKQIGYCYFSILRTYSRPISEEARIRYANSHKISIDFAPTEQIITLDNKFNDYIIKDNILTLSNGREYNLKKICCKLSKIAILDARFIGVGLGSVMYEELERIAREYNCEYIKAMYYPNGDFLFSTKSFYDRNGFTFNTQGQLTYVYKELKNLTFEKIGGGNG